jgi:hypothetical protein
MGMGVAPVIGLLSQTAHIRFRACFLLPNAAHDQWSGAQCGMDPHGDASSRPLEWSRTPSQVTPQAGQVIDPSAFPSAGKEPHPKLTEDDLDQRDDRLVSAFAELLKPPPPEGGGIASAPEGA